MEYDKKILIIDDDPTVRKSLEYYFNDEKIPFVTAENGETGLEMISNNDNNDLKAVIVDIRLPGIDGLKFIYKAHRLAPDLKFIIYTGSSTFSITSELQQMGVTQEMVFYKPLPDLGILTEKIKELYSS